MVFPSVGALIPSPVDSSQVSSPNGLPRLILQQSDFNSFCENASFTRTIQFGARGISFYAEIHEQDFAYQCSLNSIELLSAELFDVRLTVTAT